MRGRFVRLALCALSGLVLVGVSFGGVACGQKEEEQSTGKGEVYYTGKNFRGKAGTGSSDAMTKPGPNPKAGGG